MNTYSRITLLIVSLVLTSCGGGGSENGGMGGTGIVSTGVMTKGSVIVNGIHFEDNSATIVSDDVSVGTGALQSGMVVKVKGRRNNDGLNGIADRVESENEVRGIVQTHSTTATPKTFTVINQNVFVDYLTTFANFSTLDPIGELVDGVSAVEVHGIRDSAGNIRATRVELFGQRSPVVDELRGVVSNRLDTSFILQGTPDVMVTYSANMVVPAGQQLSNGMLVEVHGNFDGGIDTFAATKVDIENLEDDAFDPAEGQEVEVEGFVTGCGNPCSSFKVNGQNVQTNNATQYVNGTINDLLDDVKVEAEGHFVNGVLLADKIKFKRVQVILTGDASGITGSIPGVGTVQIMNNTIYIDSLTKVSTGDTITAEPLEVRGFLDSNGKIVAEEVKDNPGGGGIEVIQARVTALNGDSLTMLGIRVDTTSALQISDVNDFPISLASFLAAISPAPAPGGTLVKAKGNFNAGILTAEEVELED